MMTIITYTDALKELKDRIRAEWNRNIRLKNRKFINKKDIPDNSAPWMECEYKNVTVKLGKYFSFLISHSIK